MRKVCRVITDELQDSRGILPPPSRHAPRAFGLGHILWRVGTTKATMMGGVNANLHERLPERRLEKERYEYHFVEIVTNTFVT